MKKKVLFPTIVGFGLLFLALLLTGIFGLTPMMNGGTDANGYVYGLKATVKNYFEMWGGTVNTPIAGFALFLVILAIVAMAALITIVILRKKLLLIAPSVVAGAILAYLGFVFLYTVPMIGAKVGFAVFVLILNILLIGGACFFEVLPLLGMFKDEMDYKDEDMVAPIKMEGVITNPYLPNYEYVPDGEPHVFNGRVYVYGSHDRFGSSGFCLNNYITWSAPIDDLTNWKFEGIIYNKTDDPLNKSRTQFYAPDVCQGPDGRFYIYYSPAPGFTKGSWVIRCAVSDSPAGPFKFHGKVELGKWQKNYAPFDPAVFVEDGHVYLYYGSALFYPVLGLSAKNILGGAVVELDPNDMLTVITEPITTVPSIQCDKDKEYGIHAFFEASSMRKFNGKYYFIYSSQAGHELFYCIGDTPVGPFRKGGTLVSNGDIGLRGIENSKDACDFTGNTHGSMVEVNGRYFVFAHRQTNKCQFSRQGFAEEIFMEKDGSFKQVERTSQGLYTKPLPGKGEYFASICCGLRAKNGNRFYGVFKFGHGKEPFLTQLGKDRDENPNQYIKNFNDGCSVTYKYFDLSKTKSFGIEVGGSAKGKLIMKYGENEVEQEINMKLEKKVINFDIEKGSKKDQVTFIYEGKGAIDLIKLILE